MTSENSPIAVFPFIISHEEYKVMETKISVDELIATNSDEL